MRRVLPACVLALAAASCGEPPPDEPGSRTGPSTDASSYGRPDLTAELGHPSYPVAGWIAPDARLVATQGLDGSVAVYEVASGREVRRHDPPDGERTYVHGFEDSTSLRLARGEEREVWDLVADRRSPVGHVPWAAAAPWAQRSAPVAGRVLEWEAQGTELRVHAADREAPLAVFTAEPDFFLLDAALTPDGARACAQTFTELVVFELDTGRLEARYEHAPGTLHSVPGLGARELVVARDGTLEVFDVSERRVVRSLAPGEPTPARRFTSFSFSADGTLFLSTSDDRSARLCEFATGRELARFGGRTDYVQGLSLSADGQRLLVASGTLWRFPIDGNEDAFSSCQNAAAVWDLARGAQGPRVLVPEERPSLFWGAALAPDGQRLALGTHERLGTWSSAEGTPLQSLSGRAGSDLAFTPDGTGVVASGSWFGAEGAPQPFESFERLSFARDGGSLVLALDTRVSLLDARTRVLRRSWSLDHALLSAALSDDGLRVHAGCDQGHVHTWRADGEDERRLELGTRAWALATLPGKDDAFMAGLEDASIVLFEDGRRTRVLEGHEAGVVALAVTPDGRHLFSGSRDQSVCVWQLESGALLCWLYSFRDGSWAVVDEQGRYDAPGGESEGLHWVVGLEAVELGQLKERFYEPGLLAKHLGLTTEEMRAVGELDSLPMPPKVRILPLAPGATKVRIELTNRGAGIGPVAVRVNRKEIVADARPRGADPQAATMTIEFDLAHEPAFVPELANVIEVVPEDAHEILSARGVSVTVEARQPAGARTPELWALVAGISDYAGTELDLRYASSDAEHFARALELCGGGLFGAARTHVELLHDQGQRATRANVLSALERLGQAHSQDLVLVYLAGHGATLGTEASDYRYVLQGALSLASLQDEAVRAAHTLSGEELKRALNTMPARKAALILDTCHAGGVADTRALSASQVRALERLEDQTGLVILAGSARGDVSFETSRFGHGLLTYSLLTGLRAGPVLDAEGNVGVLELLGFARDDVPRLARQLKQHQEPQLAMPRGGQSFALGRLDDRSAVPLAVPRALVRRPNFFRAGTPIDPAGLGSAVTAALDERARGGDSPLATGAADDAPDAYLVGGSYRADGERLVVAVQIYRGNQDEAHFELSGTVAELAPAIAARLEDLARR
jgi:WD40 repeat protein